MDNKLKVYIKTFGCQMNEHESERMCGLLVRAGYTPVSSENEADLIIINSCSIRQKAEQKAFSFLGRLRSLKDQKPGLRIGFGGCIAQREGKRVFIRSPVVDLVFGTKNIHRLPALIEKVRLENRPVVEIIRDDHERGEEFHCPVSRAKGVKAWVTIMQGCNNYCTYCVVPYLRGSEWSRPAEEILHEIKGLAGDGYKEITLLGHNVNSYQSGDGGRIHFPDLLRLIQGVEGIERIRFTTSHPKDFSQELVEAIAACPKVCGHIHLPFQSGSDKILQRMNRKYTAKEYLAKVEMLRQHIPNAAITSDVIVGFPGETHEDFQQTLRLIEEVKFEGLFTFLYSIRPQAEAGNFSDQVPNNIKQERFEILLQIQNDISSDRNRALLGTRQEILVEGVDEATGEITDHENKLRGRTGSNKLVEFTSEIGSSLIGSLRQVEIIRANRFNLEGKLV